MGGCGACNAYSIVSMVCIVIAETQLWFLLGWRLGPWSDGVYGLIAASTTGHKHMLLTLCSLASM